MFTAVTLGIAVIDIQIPGLKIEDFTGVLPDLQSKCLWIEETYIGIGPPRLLNLRSFLPGNS